MFILAMSLTDANHSLADANHCRSRRHSRQRDSWFCGLWLTIRQSVMFLIACASSLCHVFPANKCTAYCYLQIIFIYFVLATRRKRYSWQPELITSGAILWYKSAVMPACITFTWIVRAVRDSHFKCFSVSEDAPGLSFGSKQYIYIYTYIWTSCVSRVCCRAHPRVRLCAPVVCTSQRPRWITTTALFLLENTRYSAGSRGLRYFCW